MNSALRHFTKDELEQIIVKYGMPLDELHPSVIIWEMVEKLDRRVKSLEEDNIKLSKETCGG